MESSHVDGFNVFSPQKSQAFLENLGYTPDTWDEIMKRRLASHQLRALIHVAQGQGPQDLVEVYRQLYPNEPMHWLKPRTESDADAERASDVAWNQLSKAS